MGGKYARGRGQRTRSWRRPEPADALAARRLTAGLDQRQPWSMRPSERQTHHWVAATWHEPHLAHIGARSWIRSVGREVPLSTRLNYFLMYTTIVDGIIPARCAIAARSPEKEPWAVWKASS